MTWSSALLPGGGLEGKISDLCSGPNYLNLGYGERIAHAHIRGLPYPFTDCSSLHRWCLSPEFASDFFSWGITE